MECVKKGTDSGFLENICDFVQAEFPQNLSIK